MNININGMDIPLGSLKSLSKEEQLDIMRTWFSENYEDPACSCPYESREGGYFYIYGGPFEAIEELQDMFEDYVKYEYINELAEELNDICYEWSAIPTNLDDWYDEDIFEAAITSEEPLEKFNDTIRKIYSLAEFNTQNDDQKNHLFGILYTNVITALETLFVELFIKNIDKKDQYIKNLLEKGKTEFKINKNILSSPFNGGSLEEFKEAITLEIKEHLVSTSWHSARKVTERFKATFSIKTSKNWPTDEIEIATQKRNHLVHRGGKDKDGNSVIIEKLDLDNLLSDAKDIAEKLDSTLKEVVND